MVLLRRLVVFQLELSLSGKNNYRRPKVINNLIDNNNKFTIRNVPNRRVMKVQKRNEDLISDVKYSTEISAEGNSKRDNSEGTDQT